MIVPDNIIQKGFIFAGLSNILGVLICSKLFTNETIMETQSAVMNYFGLISIILWGFAYIAVCKTYKQVRWLVGLFVIEKLAYVVVWMGFITTQSLSTVYDKDFMAGIFYSIYGVNDFLFMIFFAYVFYQSSPSKLRA